MQQLLINIFNLKFCTWKIQKTNTEDRTCVLVLYYIVELICETFKGLLTYKGQMFIFAQLGVFFLTSVPKIS